MKKLSFVLEVKSICLSEDIQKLANCVERCVALKAYLLKQMLRGVNIDCLAPRL